MVLREKRNTPMAYSINVKETKTSVLSLIDGVLTVRCVFPIQSFYIRDLSFRRPCVYFYFDGNKKIRWEGVGCYINGLNDDKFTLKSNESTEMVCDFQIEGWEKTEVPVNIVLDNIILLSE
jgi:preprotein translocase subunit SecB